MRALLVAALLCVWATSAHAQQPKLDEATAANLMARADTYFNNHQITIALETYKKVIQFPKAPERLAAMHKVGQCHHNMGDYTKALRAFVQVIQDANKSNDPGHQALRKASLGDLIFTYAEVGKPTRAIPFFKKIAKNEAEALRMTEDLAYLYGAEGRFDAGVTLFKTLIKIYGKSVSSISFQSEILKLTPNIGGRTEILTEATRSVALLQKTTLVAPAADARALVKASSRLELQVFELARIAFVERHRPDSIEHARSLLELYERGFPKGKYRKQVKGMLSQIEAP